MLFTGLQKVLATKTQPICYWHWSSQVSGTRIFERFNRTSSEAISSRCQSKWLRHQHLHDRRGIHRTVVIKTLEQKNTFQKSQATSENPSFKPTYIVAQSCFMLFHVVSCLFHVFPACFPYLSGPSHTFRPCFGSGRPSRNGRRSMERGPRPTGPTETPHSRPRPDRSKRAVSWEKKFHPTVFTASKAGAYFSDNEINYESFISRDYFYMFFHHSSSSCWSWFQFWILSQASTPCLDARALLPVK